MNIALSLPDELVREARHHAASQSKSLSAWMVDLVSRELDSPSNESEASLSLAEAMKVPGMPASFFGKDLALPDRKKTKHREFTFDPDGN